MVKIITYIPSQVSSTMGWKWSHYRTQKHEIHIEGWIGLKIKMKFLKEIIAFLAIVSVYKLTLSVHLGNNISYFACSLESSNNLIIYSYCIVTVLSAYHSDVAWIKGVFSQHGGKSCTCSGISRSTIQ